MQLKFLKQDGLTLEKMLKGFLIKRVVHSVSVDCTLHQSALHQFIHVMVDGVAAEPKAADQLLNISIVAAKIAENIKTSGIS